jgi:hypothetical protein
MEEPSAAGRGRALVARALGFVLLAALALAWVSTSPAVGPRARSSRADLARDVAASVAAHQSRSGRYANYVARYPGFQHHTYSHYAEGLLGYAVLEAGIRAGDRRLIQSGLRALLFAVRKREQIFPGQEEFETLGVASAFELIESTRVVHDPLYRRYRPDFVRWLGERHRTEAGLYSQYSNHQLVDAVAVLALVKTGLRSRDRRAVLGGDRANSVRAVRRMINVQIPALAGRFTRGTGATRTALLGDPPSNALAYHGLTMGLYARAITLMRPAASARARATLRRMANAAWALAAPDGMLAYHGRSQEAIWALAGAAYGADAAAKLPGSPRLLDRRYQALAARATERIRDAYGPGRLGWWITPALRSGSLHAARGLDPYASAPAYLGNALVMLNWSVPWAQSDALRGAIAADRNGTAIVSRGESATATVRRGDVWYAIKGGTSAAYSRDLRYGFGLVAMERRTTEGAWSAAIPLRPRTEGSQRDSAGPMLLARGARAVPFATRVVRGGAGSITLVGGFRHRGTNVRTGVRFRYSAVGCGVRLRFPVGRGDALEYSAFFRDDGSLPRRSRTSVRDERQSVTFSRAATVRFRKGYGSGLDPAVLRARIRFRRGRAGRISITTCARPPS